MLLKVCVSELELGPGAVVGSFPQPATARPAAQRRSETRGACFMDSASAQGAAASIGGGYVGDGSQADLGEKIRARFRFHGIATAMPASREAALPGGRMSSFSG